MSVFDVADYEYNVQFYRFNIETVPPIDVGANKKPAYIKSHKSPNKLIYCGLFVSLMTSLILASHNFA